MGFHFCNNDRMCLYQPSLRIFLQSAPQISQTYSIYMTFHDSPKKRPKRHIGTEVFHPGEVSMTT